VIHWLRHAHASHAIDNGAPITGHSDLKTTSVYAHARPGERQQCRYLKTKFPFAENSFSCVAIACSCGFRQVTLAYPTGSGF
jgi:hypothetical protein